MVRYRYTVMDGQLPRPRPPSIKGCEPKPSEAEDVLRSPRTRTLPARDYTSETSDTSKNPSLTKKNSRLYGSSGINKQTVRTRDSRHVTETLMQGIQLSFQRQPDNFNSMMSTSAMGPGNGENNGMTQMAGMQPFSEGSLTSMIDDSDDDDSEQPDENMVFPGFMQGPSDYPLEDLNDAVDEHFSSREPHVVSSSNRLQAALNLGTESLWHDESSYTSRATGSMSVESGIFTEPSMTWHPNTSSGLRQWLQIATSSRGGKRLCARSISFKALKTAEPGGIGASNGREPETIMAIDDRWGSITIYQTDILQTSGLVCSWTWVKITKPVFMVSESNIGPLSWVVFAIPSDRVKNLEETWVASPPQPSDNFDEFPQPEQRSLRLVMRYSNAETPRFACSKKQADLVYPGCGHEFLTVGTLPRYDSNSLETYRPVVSEFEKRSCEDKLRWQEVQAAMAKYACIVEIESRPGSGWKIIAPGGASSLDRGDITNSWDSTGLNDSESIDEGSIHEVQRQKERGNHIDRGSQSPKAGYDIPLSEHSRPGPGISTDDSGNPCTPVGQIQSSS